MKRLFEILLTTSIFFGIIYLILYAIYFKSLCYSLSGDNEENIPFAIEKIAICKDSLVCSVGNIEFSENNEIRNWDCVRKDSPILASDIYINIFNHFINSIKN